jgi:flagellar biosynthetic protein FliP
MEGLDRAAAGALYPTVEVAAAPTGAVTSLSKLKLLAVAFAIVAGVVLMGGKPASAAPAANTPPPNAGTTAGTKAATAGATAGSTAGATAGSGAASVNLNLGDTINKPSQSITIIVALTLLTVAPALLMMMTSFTRIVIVLSLTRNALGLQSIPPNQVVVGLALFLSLFVMGPTLSQMNKDAVQPYMHGQITQGAAYDAGVKPLRAFMLKQTRKSELAMFTSAAGQAKPKNADDVGMAALVPAFVLSELKTAFIIGFIVFIPFLVIDLIVSSSLMSMGMMMLPPVLVSLPFKILLFVLVDGWALVVKSLLTSFH